MLLLYAFKPFGDSKTNISEQVLSRVFISVPHKKYVFPVEFDESKLIKLSKKYTFTHVLGLGQYTTGSKLRFERKAKNMMGSKSDASYKMIDPTGPDCLFGTWKYPAGIDAFWRSYDAGKFVCNYYFFRSLQLFPQASVGFVHIPKKLSIQAGLNTVKELLAQL